MGHYTLKLQRQTTVTVVFKNNSHYKTLLLDNITFLNDQLHQKDKVLDSLINQLLKQNNYLFQKRNTDDQLETNLESVESKE